MSAEGFDAANLAQWVYTRRQELDLSHDDVARRGGPSTTKMSQIENRQPVMPRRDVLQKLDKALRWRPGSARIVALGGDPVPLPAAPAATPEQDIEEFRRKILAAPFLSEDQKRTMLAALDQDPPEEHTGAVGA